jgi:serine/threonine-protein kinase
MASGYCAKCRDVVTAEGLRCPRDGSLVGDDPRDPKTSALVGKLVATRYRVVKQLGEGGMGEVFLAQHEALEKPVALKVLKHEYTEREDVVARFQQEAKSASRIKHPNVVDVFDFGQLDDGRFFLALEYLEGHDLGVEMDKGRLSPSRSIDIVLHVCAALGAAHVADVVHRDMKPENVFLCRHGKTETVKIVDFGIAKLRAIGEGLEGGPKARRLTRAGAIFGTPEYMAPEQVEGTDVDARADVYAVGVMLYELLTGRVPFSGTSPVHTLTLVVRDPVPKFHDVDPTHDVSAMLEAVVMQALEKSPGARFASMDELAAALRSTPEAMELPVPQVAPRLLLPEVPLPPPAPPPRPSMISSALPIPLVPRARRTLDLVPSELPPAPSPTPAPTAPPAPRRRGLWVSLVVVLLAVLCVLGVKVLSARGATRWAPPSSSLTQ